MRQRSGGREPQCFVSREQSADSLNSGLNGGRICWIVTETRNTYKFDCTCFDGDFHRKLMEEEGLLNSCRATGEYLINAQLALHNAVRLTACDSC